MSSRLRHGARSLGIDGPSATDELAERSTQFKGEKAASFDNPGRLILEQASDNDEMLMSLMGAGALASSIDQIFIALNNGKYSPEEIGINRERVANIANSAGALQFLGMGISLLKKYGYEAKDWLKTYRVPA